MKAVIFHIYGPFAIQSYGLCIAIGVLLSFYLLVNDKKMKSLISLEQLFNCFYIAFIAAVLGGRLLFFINHRKMFHSLLDFFALWKGGLSVLGCIALTILSLVIYLKKKKIPLLQFLDRTALYAPIMQGFGRIGCFLSGCCYGQTCHLPWAVTYTDLESKAPLYIGIHPTQIYSALLHFCLFFFLYFFLQRKNIKPGIIFFIYIITMSIIRFSVDFLRWDREFLPYFKGFSISQIIAILILICGIKGLLITLFSKKNHGSI